MKMLVVFVEEESAKELLDVVLPKILNEEYQYRIIPFEGKQDLDKNVERKIRLWQTPNTKFIILRDQDSADCTLLKSSLLVKCMTKSQDCLVRIVCRELESWYLGDLMAVEIGLGGKVSKHQNNAKFRNPDALNNAKEELIKLTGHKYQEISGSRAIAPHMDIANNCSYSFGIFVGGVKTLCV